MTTVTVWNEYRHERESDTVAEIYPDGIHAVIADVLSAAGFETQTATLDEPDHGLTDDVLAETDVLTWWGHAAHDEVRDEIVDRVHEHVLDGMGLIVLHSGHYSKIFKRLMGTSCSLKWREAAERERLWVVEPSHPIADGVGEYIEVDDAEMYGERFDIPAPSRSTTPKCTASGSISRLPTRSFLRLGSKAAKCSGLAVVTAAATDGCFTFGQATKRIQSTTTTQSSRW